MLIPCSPKTIMRHAALFLLAASLSFPPPAIKAEEFSEYDLLLLDFTLERRHLAQSVTAYRLNNTIVVSLAEAAAALEFPIVVDGETGMAKGWTLNKERRFTLDIDKGTVTIEGKTQPLGPNDATLHEDAVYVPLDTFSRWFPVDLSAQLDTMSVNVIPREKLPAQLRAARRQSAGKRFVLSPPALPEKEMPYHLIGSHTADLSLGYYVERNTEPKISSPRTSVNYSTLIRGDLAYMTSAIYLGGNDTESLGYARMTLSRSRPDTPAGISKIELGDITPTSIRGAPQNNFERGLLIKGSTYQDADLYSLDGNQTHIYGDVLEGWEVELLHNGVRIDYQIIGAEGRYDFRNLNLFSGTNTFELVFYGPAGERYSKFVTRYAGSGAIRQGNFNYQLSLSQKNRTLYESPFEIINTTDPTNRGTGRYAASMNYGVLSNLSVGSSWNSVVLNGERLNYFHLGFRTGWRNFNLGVDATRDPLGGTIWDGVIGVPASAQLLGFNVQFQHIRYANSVLNTDDKYDVQIRSRSNITITGSHNKISSRISAVRDRLVNSSTTYYTVNLAKNTGNFRIGNTLYYQLFDNPNQPDESARFSGNLYFTGKLAPLNIRGSYNYQIKPEKDSLLYQLNADMRVATDMSMHFSLEHIPVTDLTRYSTGFNWHLKHITLTPRISYDSDGRYTGFVLATLSLSPRPDRKGVIVSGSPMANRGGIASRVFFDEDNDGKFSAGDRPIPNVDIYAAQIFRHATTDKYGTAYLTGLSPNRATDVNIDQDSLPDISMHSGHAGNSVRPRPARWAVIDFPVVSSGEIDGTLYQKNDDGQAPKQGVMIELRDANNEVVDFRVSSYDGFFLFDDIPFGKYTLHLSEKDKHQLVHAAPHIRLNQSTPNKPGVNIVIADTKQTSVSLFPIGKKSTIIPMSVAPIVKPVATQPITYSPPADKVSSFHALQLGAFRSQTSAEAAITQLQRRFHAQLQGLTLRVSRIELDKKGVYYRVYAEGDMDEATAKARCQEFKQLKQSCIAIKR